MTSYACCYCSVVRCGALHRNFGKPESVVIFDETDEEEDVWIALMLFPYLLRGTD